MIRRAFRSSGRVSLQVALGVDEIDVPDVFSRVRLSLFFFS